MDLDLIILYTLIVILAFTLGGLVEGIIVLVFSVLFVWSLWRLTK